MKTKHLLSAILTSFCVLAIFLSLHLWFSHHSSNIKTELSIITVKNRLAPDMLEAFSKKYNCNLNIQTMYNDDDLYEAVKSGTPYDVIITEAHIAERLANEAELMKLKLPYLYNLKHSDPLFLLNYFDTNYTYSAPYARSYSGLTFNYLKIKNFKASWTMLDQVESFEFRMAMEDDMRLAIGAALKYLGYSVNTVDENQLKQAQAVLKRWQYLSMRFESSERTRLIVNKQLWTIQSDNREALICMEKNRNLLFVIPEEGTMILTFCMAIPTTTLNRTMAHKFINFFHKPHVAEKNMRFLHCQSPNMDACKLMPLDFHNNSMIFPPPDTLAKSEVLRDVGKYSFRYEKIWMDLKSAQAE